MKSGGWKCGELGGGNVGGEDMYFFFTDRTMMRGFGWRWKVAEE